MQETSLKKNPLSNRQNGFRSGYSTETAISDKINEIEKGIKRKNFSLAVFIDIASAFDRLSPEAAVKAMKKKGIDEDIIRWYKNYLTSRIAIVDIIGIKVTRNLHLGCPRGGVLSVIIWNLVFDLKKITKFF